MHQVPAQGPPPPRKQSWPGQSSQPCPPCSSKLQRHFRVPTTHFGSSFLLFNYLNANAFSLTALNTSKAVIAISHRNLQITATIYWLFAWSSTVGREVLKNQSEVDYRTFATGTPFIFNTYMFTPVCLLTYTCVAGLFAQSDFEQKHWDPVTDAILLSVGTGYFSLTLFHEWSFTYQCVIEVFPVSSHPFSLIKASQKL